MTRSRQPRRARVRTQIALAHLWRAIDNDELSPGQWHQLLAMPAARCIPSKQRAAPPEEARPRCLPGLVPAILRLVAHEAPQLLLAALRLAELVDQLGLLPLAASLPQ